MEKYKDFLERISYQQNGVQFAKGDFVPDKRVLGKVAPDNSLRDFFGDTIVFDLNSSTKEKISGIIEKLYEKFPECFAEKLNTSTLHMTLHDLSASEDLEKVSQDVFRNEIKLLEVLREQPVEVQTVQMKTNYIINMVNTSLVLTLVPADKDEWKKLQVLYALADKVRVCPYPYLTPHITLAYFSRKGFDENCSNELKKLADELNQKRFNITLNTKKLVYQKFISMNDYISVFPLVVSFN